MKKSALTKIRKKSLAACSHSIHSFVRDEIKTFQKSLLIWYSENKRQLPWRDIAENEKDGNVRGYSVWVSEIMLQQTQVATVINYYSKWMDKFPTLEALSKASLDDVHKLWAGLGYYSRGTRLLEGAKKVCSDLDNQLPTTAEGLIKEIPGVGRYTAGAIASIAYGERTGAVDGNVIRVMARLRAIGGDTTNQNTVEHIWSLANECVDHCRPGDFNQALMELGATVCTPKNPLCASCPVNVICKAYERSRSKEAVLRSKDKKKKLEIAYDIDDCHLCLPKDSPYVPEDGVQNYPRKKKKTAPRTDTATVYVAKRTLEDREEFLMFQRPCKGLLANLWEFPSCSSQEDADLFLAGLGLSESGQISSCGDVFHQFSHISQTYSVNALQIDHQCTPIVPPTHQELKWFTAEEIESSAVSTAMKKVFQVWKKSLLKRETPNPSARGRKRKSANLENGDKKQQSVALFFKKQNV